MFESARESARESGRDSTAQPDESAGRVTRTHPSDGPRRVVSNSETTEFAKLWEVKLIQPEARERTCGISGLWIS